MPDLREAIQSALAACAKGNLTASSKALFNLMGYESERSAPWTLESFLELGASAAKPLTAKDQTELRRIKSLHLLFQVGDGELSRHGDLFDSSHAVDSKRIHSYLFFAIDLPAGHYTRTDLTTIARLINKPLPMPAIVLFRHGEKDEPLLSLAILRRKLNKRESSKDVLEKATLTKDIRCADPIRAHLDILNEFSLPNLREANEITNFVQLHAAWEKKLDSYALSNTFYREIADWYFWALHQVEDGVIRLPEHCDTEQEKSLFLIRLLTRVIFCWFLVEKRLIPADLFRVHSLQKLIKDFHPSTDPKKPDSSPAYYHAILQNLFFGTLNMPPKQRAFRERKKEGERFDPNFGITTLWRHEATFHDPAAWTALAGRVPFLNGGLFDCLDDKTGKKTDNTILDGFSDNPKLSCRLPNDLFFGPERTVDLSKDYGEEDKRTARSKKAKVRGLIEILSRYKFTIEENTPLEEEIALDPELLGKVFENLLASYNEDTRTTARKALGAFYTPREIVSYMVDESLKSYLASQVPKCKGALEDLFSNKATLKEVKPDTREALIAAIGRVKVLDPACGSGAFPMGALHRLVDLLQKLDPENARWREIQRQRALAETEQAFKSGDRETREQRLKEINDTFEFNSSDYGRKLYLIENAIYGVDIQPVAVQIAKLRFFIALVVDQRVCPQQKNLGVRPLPNLETRLVAADSLIPIPRPSQKQGSLFDDHKAYQQVEQLKQRLQAVRHEHFNARDPRRKRTCKEQDQEIRAELGAVLEKSGMDAPAAAKLAAWDPYDQNSFAPFFDSEWMFGLPIGKVPADSPTTPATLRGNLGLINETSGQTELTEAGEKLVDSGFDVVIGNPPYVRMEEIKHYKDVFRVHYSCFTGRADLYVYFYETGLHLLRCGGVISFITSNKYFRAAYGETLRKLLASTTHIQHLIDFGDAPVFTAIAYPSIIIAQKLPEGNKPDNSATVRALLWEPGPEVERFAEIVSAKSIRLPQSGLLGDAWRITGGAVSSLIERIRNVGTTLRKLSGDRIYYGVKTGLNDAFIIDSVTRKRLVAEDKRASEIIKPFIRGRDVKRWSAESNGQWLIYTRKGIDIRHYPSVAAYMRPFKKALEARATKQEWYELQQPQYAYSSAFESPKIIYPDIYEHQSFAVDMSGSYLANTCYFLPISDKWLCGILNSAIVEWFYSHISNSVRGGYLRAFTDYVRQIPIPQTERAQCSALDRMVELLSWITCQFASSSATQTTRDPLMLAYWERVLNGLVYELYFPEEVHGAGLRLFELVEKAKLPDVNALAEKDRLPRLRQKFEELHDGTHPLRKALDKLQTLETVRIIEGKA